MNEQVDFYGPVDVYARREDGEWVAWADPFSEVGTGPTFDDAVADLQDNLEAYFGYVAEEMEKHGDNVQVLVPLDDDLKRAEKTAQFFVYAVCPVGSTTLTGRRGADAPQEAATGPSRSRPSGVDGIVQALRSRREIHVSPVLCQAR